MNGTGVLDLARRILHFLLALPVEATPFARQVDDLQYAELTLFGLMGLVVFAVTGWCLVRYRRREPLREGFHTERVVAPLWMELGVAGTLLAIFLAWWVWGFSQYASTQAVPSDAYEVYVTGKQWMWKFDYPEGRTTAGVLFVPQDRDVRLLITSRDVIHSFYVPDFRIKQDAVPGRYLTFTFKPTIAGPHDVMCAEFCGPGHSRMWGQVVVLPPDQFDRWVRTGRAPLPEGATGPVGEPPVLSTEAQPPGQAEPQGSLAEQGRAVAARLGCSGCHSVDGRHVTAPSWLDLWGRREVMQNGDTVTVDAGYVTESMMDPEAEIVAGYKPIMPSFQGIATPADVAAIIEYIQSLSGGENEEGG